jgi:DNA-binding IclR family transcriptional regulator
VMQPIRRALNLLNVLAESDGGLTLQELASRMELPPSTVHRLASVLEEEGYLTRTPAEKRFMLGRRVRALVASTSSAFLQQAVQPELVRLNRSTQEAVFVAEFVGSEVVCIAFRPGTRPLRLFVSLGAALPPHAASSARVLYSSLDPDEVRTLLKDYEYTSWTPRTITREAQLLRHLELVRSRGYDIDDDEMNDSAWAVSAPVRDITGQVRAALAVVAPVSQVADPTRREMLLQEVLRGARNLSAELGFPDVANGISPS